MSNYKKIKKFSCIIVGASMLTISATGMNEIAKATDSGHNSNCSKDLCEHGYHTFNDYYLKSANGSKNGKKYYYIDTSTFQSADIQYVLAGFSEWMTIEYIRNYIDLNRTYSQTSAQITIKKGSVSEGAAGITAYCLKAGDSFLEAAPYGNYYKTLITLDESLNTSQLRLVSIHEIGHAMGLSHAECQEYNSVMWPAYDNMAGSITSFDKKNLRHIYC